MYPVSNEYKEALLKSNVSDRISGTIALADGTVLAISDQTLVNNSLKISHELCGSFKIGTFNLGCLQMTIFDDGALMRDFSGAEICPVYQLQTKNGWESVPMGIYLVQGSSVRRKRNTVSLTAYDYGIRFDQILPEGKRSASASAAELITLACGECGVTLGGIADGLPNSAVRLSSRSAQVQTYRDLVLWCASLLCGYAVIDREGKLRILSAKYGIQAGDPETVTEDRLFTAEERDSITVTDTRAYIGRLNAYNGDTLQTYVSNIEPSDSQAAEATYQLSANPLLPSGLSKTDYDAIYRDWLSYIDGFLQRGITAQLYGDPALDVGDLIRCSGGDVDQRRSILGVVTKQEWRYRNFHTVICAAPQLTEQFSAGDGSAGSEQLEKKIAGAGKYTSGQGIKISGNTIYLAPAGYGAKRNIGGVYLNSACGLSVGDDGLLGMNSASKSLIGGLKISDGLERQTGDSGVFVRLGRGLQFVKNDTTKEGYYTGNPSEHDKDMNYRGRAIEPLLGKGMELGPIADENNIVLGEGIQPRLGAGLKFSQYYKYDENGKLVPGDWFIEPNLGKNLSTDRYGKINAETPSFYTGSFVYTVSGTLYFHNVGVYQEKPIAVFIYCGELFNGIRNNQVWFGYPDMGTVMTDSPGAKYIIIGEQPTGGWLVRFCPQQEIETSKGMTFHYFIVCEAG